MTAPAVPRSATLTKDDYQYGFSDPDKTPLKSRRGRTATAVRQIPPTRQGPDGMLIFRLRALDIFLKKLLPSWPSADLTEIDFDNIFYYLRPTDNSAEKNWDDVPPYIKDTFDKLGIPEAERKFLAGVSAQYESEVVYHSIREDLEKQGVIFFDMDSGLRQYPELVKEYFATVIPAADNKFSALNSAVWSGGSFIYVPKNTHVELPLQAYFRINAENMGQFERTLIIADEGARVHYIEGCTAPTYSSDSLHSAVVELIAKPGAHIRYTTIQNWSNNVYNLVTKRAVAYEGATVEWVDGNLGSKVTIKYPAVYLLGRGARAEILSVAFAGAGQMQDAGGKVIHVAPDTTSTITSKSISKDGGHATYRGLLKVAKCATHAKSFVRCDALLLDEQSRSNTYPSIEIDEEQADIGHEATVSKVSDEQLFYLQSRGLTEIEAKTLIVNGFFDAFVKELPMEYAVELNRLLALQMEGSIG